MKMFKKTALVARLALLTVALTSLLTAQATAQTSNAGQSANAGQPITR
ncbi:MAG: hypothetical protein NTY70_03185 [Burkholderiales bacterium]|nr:hypothetical protein [Burkholderiales bacterium]